MEADTRLRQKSDGLCAKNQQYGDDIQKLQATDRKHEERIDFTTETLRRVLHEFDKDREIGARDREILILKLEAALREGAPLKISGGAASQGSLPDLAAEIAALRSEVDELKKRVAALENS